MTPLQDSGHYGRSESRPKLTYNFLTARPNRVRGSLPNPADWGGNLQRLKSPDQIEIVFAKLSPDSRARHLFDPVLAVHMSVAESRFL